MPSQMVANSFEDWRKQARQLLLTRTEPAHARWMGPEEAAGELELDLQSEAGPSPSQGGKLAVPSNFLWLAEKVACHAAPRRWDLLYRALWRVTLGGERELLRNPVDPLINELRLMEKAVNRERHKMTAFVRFRKVNLAVQPDDRESYVAWYEPEHDVLRLTAPFFRDRFATMNWSILTPKCCAHWDGHSLRFTSGAKRDEAPAGDELEEYWKSYYASIFNPARLNIPMMEREMPRRYWRNLPEAELIAELASGAYNRASAMVEEAEAPRPAALRRPAGAPDGREVASCASPDEIRWRASDLGWDATRELASRCQACELCQRATQTVFGEGPVGARLMIVGEQPGDQEDVAGRAFVGPAGQLLDSALREAGIDRERSYVTNAVKHFKWRPSGKRRLHQRPSVADIQACSGWLEAEIRLVQPSVILCLGASAARAVLKRDVPVVSSRGLLDDPGFPFRIVVSYHPSYLLRVAGEEAAAARYAEFIEDLKVAATVANA